MCMNYFPWLKVLGIVSLLLMLSAFMVTSLLVDTTHSRVRPREPFCCTQGKKVLFLCFIISSSLFSLFFLFGTPVTWILGILSQFSDFLNTFLHVYNFISLILFLEIVSILSSNIFVLFLFLMLFLLLFISKSCLFVLWWFFLILFYGVISYFLSEEKSPFYSQIVVLSWVQWFLFFFP